MAVRRGLPGVDGLRGFGRRFAAALRYVLAAGGTGLVGLAGVYVLLAVSVLSLIGPGLYLLPPALSRLRRAADAQRRWSGRWLDCEIPSDYRPAEGRPLVRAQAMLTDRATYADLLWLPVHALLGVLGAALSLMLCAGAASWLTVPLWWQAVPAPAQLLVWEIDSWWAVSAAFAVGLAYAVLAGWLLPWCAQLHALATRALLRPRRRRVSLAERVQELTVTRAEALEAHAAELRRIERDLHDGAQAGMVSVSLRLALVKRALEAGPERLPEALAMLERTREVTEQAVRSLRGAVRSIYPPVLLDHGLAEAARSLVAACQIPTELDVEDEAGGTRAPVAVEAAAYFVLSEALTNTAKHSGAAHGRVHLRITARAIHIVVRDDGRGGAVPGAGSGIRGIERRVAAFDGVTELDSPPGGPTELRVELPCGS
ncbi:sensor histidine kinase [Streptomyces sp. NRRL WC-3742]|uniref:sensor histidine kinase n=1 Tax=Streptomyces sp. NRRL WC-3742 TaxID=1463934 RepID=UPI001F1CF2D7|nr:sensor histidine kinase [Streptomyces sp. NRRL WC-3742]